MPENEFEKKVSSQMQELKVKPSEKVWLQVEERIRKKKKRRVFMILFLLAGLGLLGYWQWDHMFTNKKTSVADSTTKPSTEGKLTPDATFNNREKEESPTVRKPDQPKKEEGSGNTTLTVSKKDKKNQSNQIVQPKKIEETEIKSTIRKTPVSKNRSTDLNAIADQPKVAKSPKDDVAVSGVLDKEPVKENKPAIVNDLTNIKKEPVVVKVDSAVTSKPDFPIMTNDSLVINSENKKVTEVNITDSTKKKEERLKDSAAIIKKDHAIKKWKWGFELTPGISSLNEEMFSFDMNKMADAYAAPQTGTGSGVPQSRVEPATSSSGFSFQAGVFAKNQMTKRSSILLGLRYGYYSDRIRVGGVSVFNTNSTNTAFQNAGVFYRASNTYRDLTNRYHFLELPLSYHVRLNKNQQKPFTANLGFSLSRMIASNAVMYDTSFGGIYYKNSSQLRKIQFSLSAGLSWTILNERSLQWSVGPVADIHVNKWLDNPFEKKKYLVFVGFRSAILFNSKK